MKLILGLLAAIYTTSAFASPSLPMKNYSCVFTVKEFDSNSKLVKRMKSQILTVGWVNFHNTGIVSSQFDLDPGRMTLGIQIDNESDPNGTNYAKALFLDYDPGYMGLPDPIYGESEFSGVQTPVPVDFEIDIPSRDWGGFTILRDVECRENGRQ